MVGMPKIFFNVQHENGAILEHFQANFLTILNEKKRETRRENGAKRGNFFHGIIPPPKSKDHFYSHCTCDCFSACHFEPGTEQGENLYLCKNNSCIYKSITIMKTFSKDYKHLTCCPSCTHTHSHTKSCIHRRFNNYKEHSVN